MLEEINCMKCHINHTLSVLIKINTNALLYPNHRKNSNEQSASCFQNKYSIIHGPSWWILHRHLSGSRIGNSQTLSMSLVAKPCPLPALTFLLNKSPLASLLNNTSLQDYIVHLFIRHFYSICRKLFFDYINTQIDFLKTYTHKLIVKHVTVKT